MLSLKDLQDLAKQATEHRDIFANNEQSVKTSLVLPFIGGLGYDYLSPTEVIAEYTADVGIKRGEKVDYAVMRDGEPIILFECKALSNALGVSEISQLFRYFQSTNADIGVLTNGVIYKFFSDLIDAGRMDDTPFMEVDIRCATEDDIAELGRFSKDIFDADGIKSAVINAKRVSVLKEYLGSVYERPDDEFARLLLRKLISGSISKRRLEEHRDLVKLAFHEFVRQHSESGDSADTPQDASDGELSSTLDQTQAAPAQPPVPIAAPVQAPPLIVPNPVGEWQPLSDVQPQAGGRPSEIMFPDNLSVAIRYWSEVVVESVRWLADNGYLNATHCPVQLGSSYIVATQPIHPNGNAFKNRKEVNAFYVNTNYSAGASARNARLIIESAGLDASQFKVRW